MDALNFFVYGIFRFERERQVLLVNIGGEYTPQEYFIGIFKNVVISRKAKDFISLKPDSFRIYIKTPRPIIMTFEPDFELVKIDFADRKTLEQFSFLPEDFSCFVLNEIREALALVQDEKEKGGEEAK
jgi:hypothetical protein